MDSNMIQLKTNAQLLAALEKVATHKLTSEEILAQRVSFVYGSVKTDSGVTRDRIKQVIVEQEGGGATECACDSL